MAMSKRVYKLLDGSELVVCKEVLELRQSPNALAVKVDGNNVIHDVLALVDVGNAAARELEYAKKQAGIWNDEAVRLRMVLEESRKIKFPRQPGGEGRWVIDYNLLEKLGVEVLRESDNTVDMEDIERLLLVLETVLGQEEEGNHEPDRS